MSTYVDFYIERQHKLRDLKSDADVILKCGGLRELMRNDVYLQIKTIELDTIHSNALTDLENSILVSWDEYFEDLGFKLFDKCPK